MSTLGPGDEPPRQAATWLPLLFMAPMALVALLSVAALVIALWQKAAGR